MGTSEVCERLRGVLGVGATEPRRSCEKRGAHRRTAGCCALVHPHRGWRTTRARAGAHRKPDSARTLYHTNTSCKQATPSEPSMTKDDDERKCIGPVYDRPVRGIALLEERRGPEPCGKLSWSPRNWYIPRVEEPRRHPSRIGWFTGTVRYEPERMPQVVVRCRDRVSTYLTIFSSSLSRGSICKLLSYISCTSPAACMLLRI